MSKSSKQNQSLQKSKLQINEADVSRIEQQMENQSPDKSSLNLIQSMHGKTSGHPSGNNKSQGRKVNNVSLDIGEGRKPPVPKAEKKEEPITNAMMQQMKLQLEKGAKQVLQTAQQSKHKDKKQEDFIMRP